MEYYHEFHEMVWASLLGSCVSVLVRVLMERGNDVVDENIQSTRLAAQIPIPVCNGPIEVLLHGCTSIILMLACSCSFLEHATSCNL
jgi:hypothetical protein